MFPREFDHRPSLTQAVRMLVQAAQAEAKSHRAVEEARLIRRSLVEELSEATAAYDAADQPQELLRLYIGLDDNLVAAEKQAAVHAARVAAACAYLQTVEDELFGRAMPQQLD
ncbi:hypothetical protein QMO56_19365 [Roseomonas sp. E05]|uniref:hypothetical protein n=1 Tax=Roseomonas sp. E05 TaxID=3046310 RepID=UPI0024BB68B7|nr:hypothetical protein [Roseomonas sp. E05]MDJ0390276.1 hypothetical protein [Roseomonas sp. E05]